MASTKTDKCPPRRRLLATAGLAAACMAGLAHGQVSDNVIRIGVLTDMSGGFSEFSGAGSVTAARMAVQDAGGAIDGRKVDVIYADHQNKPDVGASIARRWIDTEQVDLIVDVPGSAVALAVNAVVKEKQRILIASSPITTELTGKQCGPTTAHWTSDSYGLAVGTAQAVVRSGGKSWYFLTFDNAAGTSLENDARAEIGRQGGTVLGSVRHPFLAPDFASFLLQAQGSGAQVIGLASGGADTVNTVKQAKEFGIKQQLAALFFNINEAKGLGLETAQGLIATEAFYWDLNDDTRAFAKRFQAERKVVPGQYQAGVYSGVAHYLKAVKAAGTDEALAVMKTMRELPVNDFFAKNGKLREDGRMVHDLYVLQVKRPGEPKGEWDIYQLLETIPGASAFRPIEESACPLVNGKKS